jgi:hypothetical protein
MMRTVAYGLIAIVCAYAGVTAYVGFRVARGIDDAKAKSMVTRIASRVIGRDAAERVAIRKGQVPDWITRSPAFWVTLRAYE